MFEVVPYRFKYNDSDCVDSSHLAHDRAYRKHFINKHELYNRNIINVFCVNKGHKNGIELHVIYRSGIIKIINPINRRIVTYLIARQHQIKRYYELTNIKLKNSKVLEIAYENYLRGYNLI